MSELLPQFCQVLVSSFVSCNAANLLNTIPLGPDHPYWAPLQQSLSYTRPESLTPQSILPYLDPIPSNTRDTFSAFILAILDNVHPIHIDQRALRGLGEAERAYGEFSRLLAVYTETNRLYAMSANGPYLHAFLNGLVLDLAKRLVKLSRNAASVSTAPSRDPTSSRSIKDITRQTIERSFQVSSSPVASGEWEGEVGKEYFVGDIMWALGNILWRIYAERKLHTQAVELRRSVQSLTPAEDKRLAVRGTKVRQADVCESWYWRGRLGVVLLDMRGAKYSLDRAWRMCPEVGWQQRRAILIRLIPINLLLGILPRPGILEEYNLPQYSTLLGKYRMGDVAGWRRELERGREWLRSRNVWLILFERGEILVWRNLFREALRLYYILNPAAPPNRCPTWIFISAATRAFANTGEVEDGDIGLEDIICVISTLIDQGLILGNLSYSQQTLVMKPSADRMGGFPKLSMVVPRTVISVA